MSEFRFRNGFSIFIFTKVENNFSYANRFRSSLFLLLFCSFANLSISLSGPMRMPDGLDEAPGAYKDIAQVIANERDLVKPLVELAPMAVIKG